MKTLLSFRTPFVPAALGCLAFLAALTGCGSPSRLRIESRDAIVQPEIHSAVYRATDLNTADLYLSDVPENVLVERLAVGLDDPSPANIIHVHLFLTPKAGRTPIDFTAANISVTHVVLTGGSMGVYGGGGFLLPSGSVGDATYGGTIREATLRLVESRPGFADRLGPSELGGKVAARRDDALADEVSARLTLLLSR